MSAIKISGCIITYNEELHIADCLRSLDFCDEILVVDSFSGDRTEEEVKALVDSGFGVPVRFISREFNGYTDQKNYATGETRYEWVYNLDADERVSPELRESLLTIKEKGPQFEAYANNRRTFYITDWARAWYPDRKIRFFKKGSGKWQGADRRELHDRFITDKKVGRLKGDILHYSFLSLSGHIRTIDTYTTIAAQEAVSAGRRVSAAGIIAHSFHIFFKLYFLKGGFRNGTLGFILAGMSSFHVFCKYSKVWLHYRKPRFKFSPKPIYEEEQGE